METDLLTRKSDSLTVELHYGNGKLAVSVTDGQTHKGTIPATAENWKEIFEHPFLYLPKEEKPQESETDDSTEFDGFEVWHSLRANKSHATDSESDWR